MKNITYSIMIMFVILLMLTTNVSAYENSTYKIEIPEEYFELGNSTIKMFMKDEANMIFIYSIESSNNVDVASMSNEEIEELMGNAESEYDGDMQITGRSKGKIGNTEALCIYAEQEEAYAEMYLMTSNKHIVIVSFISENKEDLTSDEFEEIKASFKMKEKFIDAKTIGRVAAIITVAIIVINKKRKKDEMW